MNDGRWFEKEEGTPQGSVISPILANLYLHHVLDVWAQAWRRKVAQGEVIIVRYADDAVLPLRTRRVPGRGSDWSCGSRCRAAIPRRRRCARRLPEPRALFGSVRPV